MSEASINYDFFGDEQGDSVMSDQETMDRFDPDVKVARLRPVADFPELTHESIAQAINNGVQFVRNIDAARAKAQSVDPAYEAYCESFDREMELARETELKREQAATKSGAILANMAVLQELAIA